MSVADFMTAVKFTQRPATGENIADFARLYIELFSPKPSPYWTPAIEAVLVRKLKPLYFGSPSWLSKIGIDPGMALGSNHIHADIVKGRVTLSYMFPRSM